MTVSPDATLHSPGTPYTITVVTSDQANAATSARVYVIMYGGKNGEENSGKIWLENGKFSRGRTDIFNVEVAKSLSPLSKVEVGHDDSGPGPGWHMEKVCFYFLYYQDRPHDCISECDF